MNITIKITNAAIDNINDLPSIIGSIVDATIPGGISISGEITEIITDDGTIIDRETIINGGIISANHGTTNGSTARDGNAPRGSLIPANIA